MKIFFKRHILELYQESLFPKYKFKDTVIQNYGETAAKVLKTEG